MARPLALEGVVVAQLVALLAVKVVLLAASEGRAPGASGELALASADTPQIGV
jgi:hypothetical protein